MPSSAIFAAWLQHVVPAIAGDELGPLLVENYQERFSSVTRFLGQTLESDDAELGDLCGVAPARRAGDRRRRARTTPCRELSGALQLRDALPRADARVRRCRARRSLRRGSSTSCRRSPATSSDHSL